MSQIELSTEERLALEQIVRQASAAQRLVERAKIILKAADGENHSHIARQLEIDRGKVINWCKRWQAAQTRLKTEISFSLLFNLSSYK